MQNKYSCDPIGWHEFTASYLHYLMEDHLSSKQNREYFSLDIVFKTRLGVSTEIRDREGILKGFLCLFPFVLYFYFFCFIADLRTQQEIVLFSYETINSL